MINLIPSENILFVDIETVPQYPEFAQLPESEQAFWEHKAQYLVKQEQTPADVYQKAGIYAEFGRIVCISAGYICKDEENAQRSLKTKSFAGDDEAALLQDFALALTQFYKVKKKAWLCAHNGKEFDFPYTARRMLINGVRLPAPLQVFGKKPWDTSFLDTMELWRFGDYKHYTTLNLLAHIFGIPTPKDDINGSQVADVYYQQHDLPRIVTYCEKDVLTTARLFLKFKGETEILNRFDE